MPCDPSEREEIPIFSLLDAEERAVLAQHASSAGSRRAR